MLARRRPSSTEKTQRVYGRGSSVSFLLFLSWGYPPAFQGARSEGKGREYPPLMLSPCRLLLPNWIAFVQSDVQLQYIHSGLAEQAEIRPLCVLGDQLANLIGVKIASLPDP